MDDQNFSLSGRGKPRFSLERAVVSSFPQALFLGLEIIKVESQKEYLQRQLKPEVNQTIFV